MRSWKIRLRPAALGEKLQRAYRYSELRKLQLWFKGKTLHWAVYLASALVLVGAAMTLHHYYSCFFYVVSVEGQEVGLVREAAEIEQFLDGLYEKGSAFYGMPVEPEQEITIEREFRSYGEEDTVAVKEALRQQINLMTDAVMLTVDQAPVIPLMSEDEVNEVIDLLSNSFISQADNVKLLEVTLLEEVAGVPCCVPPEAICTPEEVASFLLDGEDPGEGRLLLASRHGEFLHDDDLEAEEVRPTVHVQTVEEVKTVEKIPFTTSYRYNNRMWHTQSRVAVPGEVGKKEITYHVTFENGREIASRKVSERVLEKPTTEVIEKGTARATPSVGSGRFLWPVSGGRISSGYRTASRPGHIGIDIIHPAGRGTPIQAADSGVVVETGSRGGLGKYIVIYHGRYYTVYAHNSVNYVSSGAKVSRGQTIAAMGSTGNASGPHLHFEVRRSDGSGVWGQWYKNAPVNPLSFFSR